jgi:hypothetical protein
VQGFEIPLSTRQISSVFKPPTGFGNPHDVAVSKDGSDIYVVEITPPYKVWKFSKNNTYRSGKVEGTDQKPVQTLQQSKPSQMLGLSKSEDSITPSQLKEDLSSKGEKVLVEDSLGASIVIMAFLTIPLLLMIGIGAIMRLRSSGKEQPSTLCYVELNSLFSTISISDS